MSGTIKVTTLQDGGSSTANLVFDTSGNATVGNNLTVTGTVAMSSSFKRNRIINGNMAAAQRGTTISSISSDGTYTADRRYITRGGTINYSQSTSSPPTGFQYYASYINQTASNPFLAITQAIETLNCYDLAGQTVTVSAYLKAAANTAGSTAATLNIGYATTADTKQTSLLTAQNFTISSSSWTRCTATFSIPANALTVAVNIALGTMAVSDGIFVTGVQLEVGSVATPYERQIYSDQLAQCQRYYQLIQATTGTTSSTANFVCNVKPVVTMRTGPSASQNGVIGISDYTNDYVQSSTSTTTYTSYADLVVMGLNNFSGLTLYRPYFTRGQNTNAITLSAEL